MSAFENALCLPRAALILIPRKDTPPSVLASGIISLPTVLSKVLSLAKDVWSHEPPEFEMDMLLQIELISPEFYRDLELEGAHQWENGARSIVALHPRIRLPMWYITFARELVQVARSQQHWRDALAFKQILNTEESPTHLNHVLPAISNLLDIVGHDVEITKGFRTSDLPVLFSENRIAGPFIDAFSGVLMQHLRAQGPPFSKVHIASVEVMGLIRLEDNEWCMFKTSKRLKAVCKFSCISV
jgi:hypothetical protein